MKTLNPFSALVQTIAPSRRRGSSSLSRRTTVVNCVPSLLDLQMLRAPF
jgi:hypothetical protein